MIREYEVIWNRDILLYDTYDSALSNAKYLVSDEITPKRYKALIIERVLNSPNIQFNVESITLVEWLDDRANSQFKITKLL